MILVMSGTVNGNKIIKRLKNKFKIVATTTTNYGANLAKNSGADEVISRPLDKDDLVELINKKDVKVLIDATHPFAKEATKNAIDACEKTGIRYIRFERPSINYKHPNVIYVDSFDEAGEIAAKIDGKVMHLAGVSTLPKIVKYLDNNKLVVRVLPWPDSIKKCLKLGIPPKNIVAMYGVFSKKLNMALIEEYEAEAIITKDSGKEGGLKNKVDAALELDTKVIIVKRPVIKKLKNKVVCKSLEEIERILANVYN